MFDHISFFHTLSFLIFALYFFILVFIVFLDLTIYIHHKRLGMDGDILVPSFISLAGMAIITLILTPYVLNNNYIANKNAQTLNAIQLEATDFNLPLKNYVAEILEQKPSQKELDGKWTTLGAYSFLAKNPIRGFHRIDFLTTEEFKVVEQYIRHCYPGEEGDIAREYMSTYPVETYIVSKNLVKAQSMTPDSDIKADCLNTASLTFLR